MTLQPVIENALKHGILPKKDFEGRIEMNVRDMGDHILIEILDNGIGYTRSLYTKGNQIALTTIEKRFDLISRMKNKKITFKIGDRVEGAGTCVEIRIYE